MVLDSKSGLSRDGRRLCWNRTRSWCDEPSAPHRPGPLQGNRWLSGALQADPSLLVGRAAEARLPGSEAVRQYYVAASETVLCT